MSDYDLHIRDVYSERLHSFADRRLVSFSPLSPLPKCMVAWVSHPEVAATGFDFKLVGGGRPGSPAWQRNVEELERTLEGDLAVALDRAGRRTVMRTLSAEYCAAIAEYDRGLREPQRYAKFRCESRIAELEAML